MAETHIGLALKKSLRREITMRQRAIFAETTKKGMERKDYLQFCRYYNGEDDPPKGVNASFWYYERHWVEFSLAKDVMFGEMLRQYLIAGYANFESMDDTPVTLKALLYNRYTHWLCTDEGFKDWYLKEYMSKAGQRLDKAGADNTED